MDTLMAAFLALKRKGQLSNLQRSHAKNRAVFGELQLRRDKGILSSLSSRFKADEEVLRQQIEVARRPESEAVKDIREMDLSKGRPQLSADAGALLAAILEPSPDDVDEDQLYEEALRARARWKRDVTGQPDRGEGGERLTKESNQCRGFPDLPANIQVRKKTIQLWPIQVPCYDRRP